MAVRDVHQVPAAPHRRGSAGGQACIARCPGRSRACTGNFQPCLGDPSACTKVFDTSHVPERVSRTDLQHSSHETPQPASGNTACSVTSSPCSAIRTLQLAPGVFPVSMASRHSFHLILGLSAPFSSSSPVLRGDAVPAAAPDPAAQKLHGPQPPEPGGGGRRGVCAPVQQSRCVVLRTEHRTQFAPFVKAGVVTAPRVSAWSSSWHFPRC